MSKKTGFPPIERGLTVAGIARHRRSEYGGDRRFAKTVVVHRRFETDLQTREGMGPMAKAADQLAAKIHRLSDVEKLRLVDSILTDLDRPDPEIDRVWAAEARERWAAYQRGQIQSVSYEFPTGGFADSAE